MSTFNCPTCKKAIQWDTSNPDRPFCSERCRMIDLGAWANEEHKISKPSGNDLMGGGGGGEKTIAERYQKALIDAIPCPPCSIAVFSIPRSIPPKG